MITKKPSQPWEFELFDWTAPGENGRLVSPDTVLDLVFSDTAEAASVASEKLDRAVCANGHALELLGDICAGESVSVTSGVRKECLKELRGSLWYFLHGLQFDAAETVWMHVDLLCLLTMEFPDLRRQVTEYLGLALTRELPNPTPELIRNTMAEIEHKTPENG